MPESTAVTLEAFSLGYASICCFFYGLLGVATACTTTCTSSGGDEYSKNVKITPILASFYCSIVILLGYFLWKFRYSTEAVGGYVQNTSYHLSTLSTQGHQHLTMSIRLAFSLILVFIIVVVIARNILLKPLTQGCDALLADKSSCCTSLPQEQNPMMFSIRATLKRLEPWVVGSGFAFLLISLVFNWKEKTTFEKEARKKVYGEEEAPKARETRDVAQAAPQSVQLKAGIEAKPAVASAPSVSQAQQASASVQQESAPAATDPVYVQVPPGEGGSTGSSTAPASAAAARGTFAPLPSAATPEDQFETLSTSSEAASEGPSSAASSSGASHLDDESDTETSSEAGDSQKTSSAPSEQAAPSSPALLPAGPSSPDDGSSSARSVAPPVSSEPTSSMQPPPLPSAEPAATSGPNPEALGPPSSQPAASSSPTAPTPVEARASESLLPFKDTGAHGIDGLSENKQREEIPPSSPRAEAAVSSLVENQERKETLLPSSAEVGGGLSEKKESEGMLLPSPSPAEAVSTQAGSVFNLQGLDEAFPLRPKESSDGLMSFEEATREAAKFGVQLSMDSLKKPQRSVLGDGSLLLVTPAQALNVTHLSSACVASLKTNGRAGQGLLSDVLKKLGSFDASSQASEALLRALQQLESQRIASDCEAGGGGLSLQLKQAIALLEKLTATLQEKTSAELVYLKHVNEFRDAKRDVKALAEVLKKDADRVAQVRGKSEAFLQRRGPALSASFSQLASQLARLEQTAKHF